MGTKDQGWSATKFRATRCLVLVLGASALTLALSARPAHADARRARDKMVELNKQALLSYEAKDWATAKELLNKALKEAKLAGLDDDKMTARTYLHLGAVYWVGYQDQAVALQNFALAKKIRPDIQLTPSIETADLKAVFNLATPEPEAAPSPQATPATTPTPARPQPRPAATSIPVLGGDEGGEPDLPTSMSAPLMCAVPDVVPPGRELSIRCALKPGLNAKVVQLHHRAPGVEAYQVMTMHRTTKGWYIATLPGNVMKAGNLQVYFDARDANDREIASNGHIDSPSVIAVRARSSGGGGGDEEDPMRRIREEQIAAAYQAGLHRRRQGAIWVGVGGGAGWGFAPAGYLEWENQIRVSAITTATGLFHLLPEIGWMYSDNFALALQVRWEFIQQQQGTWKDPTTQQTLQITPTWMSGAPTSVALAAFARAIWYTDLTSSGNLQLSYSGDIGGGYVRFPVLPSNITNKNDLDFDASSGTYSPNHGSAIALTDTRPIGPVLVGASVGFIYHFSRHIALSLDGRALTGLPAFGVVVEGALSAQFAFGGAAGPSAPAGEEDEGDEGGVVNDAPPAYDSSSEEEEE